MSTVAATFRPIPIRRRACFAATPAPRRSCCCGSCSPSPRSCSGSTSSPRSCSTTGPPTSRASSTTSSPGAQDAMYMVGVVEILAGLIVFVAQFGGLARRGLAREIIVGLLLVGGYGDIAPASSALRRRLRRAGPATAYRLATPRTGARRRRRDADHRPGVEGGARRRRASSSIAP